MDHFPNLPRDPAPPAPVRSAATTAAAANAAKKSFNLMYVWVGLAAASFAGLGYWGMLRPAPTDADPTSTAFIPEVKSADERAKEDALTNMVKRLKEAEANRIIVLEGPRNASESGAGEHKTSAPRAPKEMVIKFTPATQPSTRPASIGGRTKPFLAPDVAEDGSFFGQIDSATGKPKTVYSSNLGKYIVDHGVDFAERDAAGAVIDRSAAAPTAGAATPAAPQPTPPAAPRPRNANR